MAYIEISNLPETLNLNDESVFPVVYQGETRKVKFNSMAKIFNYFTSISYNKTIGVYTFTRVDGTSALLSTDLQKSFKDVSLSNGIITFTAHSGETKTIDISIPDNSITLAKLVQELQTKINSIDNKVDKVVGKGLSTNDFTNELKTKLEGLENYDDTEIIEQIEELQAENDQLWNDHPDITDTGTDLTLQGTGNLKMKVDVGGNSTQTQYEGYQLLDINQLDLDDVKVVDYGLSFVTINFSSVFESIGYLSCKLENKIYSFKGKLTDGRFEIRYYLNETQVGSADIVTSFKKIDNSNGLYDEVHITPSNGNTIDKITFSDMILVEGEYTSDTMPNWEPYVGNQASPNPTYKQDINNVEGDVVVKGKNRQLFDKDNANILNGYFTPSDTTFVTNNAHRSVYIPCKSDTTYTVQKIATSRFRVGFTDILPANGVTITNSMPSSTNGENLTEVTATSGANSKYLIAWVYNSNTTSEPSINNILNSLQIVEGSTAKPYTAYAENTVTFPLSQGQKLMLGDTLEDDGIHHKRNQVVFDGSNDEDWRLDNSFTNTCKFSTRGLTNALAVNRNKAICSHFTMAYNDDNDYEHARNSSSGFPTDFLIYIDKNKASSVAELRAWLQENQITVEYELAEETIDPYTSQQQTAYNKLKEMQSYYDLTYVVGTSDNAQPIITAHAKKSLKVINDEISNINSRLTLLEE